MCTKTNVYSFLCCLQEEGEKKILNKKTRYYVRFLEAKSKVAV